MWGHVQALEEETRKHAEAGACVYEGLHGFPVLPLRVADLKCHVESSHSPTQSLAPALGWPCPMTPPILRWSGGGDEARGVRPVLPRLPNPLSSRKSSRLYEFMLAWEAVIIMPILGRTLPEEPMAQRYFPIRAPGRP